MPNYTLPSVLDTSAENLNEARPTEHFAVRPKERRVFLGDPEGWSLETFKGGAAPYFQLWH
jgi:hypothetical protein